MAACFGLPVDIIEPCGFPFSDRGLKRAGMDYAEQTAIRRHADWEEFRESVAGRRVLLTVRGDTALPDAHFSHDDILIAGSESAGVPAHVRDAAELCIRIPMRSSMRSLNVAVATALAVGEMLRQTQGWPSGDHVT